MLPEDISGANASSVLVKLLSAVGYAPAAGRKWAFLPAQHFGFEAAA